MAVKFRQRSAAADEGEVLDVLQCVPAETAEEEGVGEAEARDGVFFWTRACLVDRLHG